MNNEWNEAVEPVYAINFSLGNYTHHIPIPYRRSPLPTYPTTGDTASQLLQTGLKIASATWQTQNINGGETCIAGKIGQEQFDWLFNTFQTTH